MPPKGHALEGLGVESLDVSVGAEEGRSPPLRMGPALSLSSDIDRDLEGGHHMQAKREQGAIRARKTWTRPSLEKPCLSTAGNLSEKRQTQSHLVGSVYRYVLCQIGKRRGI